MTSRVAAASSSSRATTAAAIIDDESSQSYTSPEGGGGADADGSCSLFPHPSTGEALKQRHTTDDTASDASGGGGSYEVIEYDLNDGRDHHHHLLRHNSDSNKSNDDPYSNHHHHHHHRLMFVGDTQLHIEDDSPAAAALRANANVEVSRVGKAARAVHMQTVRKIVKRATMTSKSGVVRGKPPRLPPTIQESGSGGSSTAAAAAAAGGSSIATVERSYTGVLDRIDETDAVEYNEQLHPDHSSVTESMMPQDAHIPDGVVKGTAEAGNKVLDQVDDHDLIKQLRWRRKRKGEYKQKAIKSYVKGKVIDGEHELYTLSIAVMIGVRTSISRTNTELNSGPNHRWIRPMDFRTTEKYEFRPKGGSLTPPHMLKHTFKFKDYAPVAFAYLRRMFGINEFDFLLSVCGNANFIEFISNAKSGQFFFYSNDGRYMIKTMTNAESKFLRRILPDYFKHCAETPNTMITRFLGMYRVKLYHLRRNMKFVIMNSVYYTDKYLQTFYDLKGSSVGRDAKPGQTVKKDNDLRHGLPQEALALRPQQRKALRAQLVSDCEFLKRMGIMDYSMLVGVHHIPAKQDADGASVANLGFRGNRPRTSSRADVGSESEHSEHYEAHHHNKLGEGHHLSDTVGAHFHENGLDEDDSSYLDGVDGKERPKLDEKIQKKKMETIEKLYWPFHRYFDIHGHRRMKPITCPKCEKTPCFCPDDKLLAGYRIPRFVPPISHRKDRGLELDTSSQKLPLTFQTPQGVQHCDGKIFFMGIIDILQEYNSRKLFESTYRSLTASAHEVSCVPPAEYADRFLKFFDEYTQPLPRTLPEEEEDDISESEG